MSQPALPKSSEPSRNQPCSCNSGKKFKKCCGSAEKHNIEVEAQREHERLRRIAEGKRIELANGASIEIHDLPEGTSVNAPRIVGHRNARLFGLMGAVIGMSEALVPEPPPMIEDVTRSKETGSSPSRRQQLYYAARQRRGR